MYIEERLQHLFDAIADFRTEVSGRLGSIETTQKFVNDHLKELNGSVAKQGSRIQALEFDSAYRKGKTAGISLVFSIIGYVIADVINWLIHHPHVTH